MSREHRAAHNVPSTLTNQDLEEIVQQFHLPPNLDARLPEKGKFITAAPPGFVGVYHQYLVAGLRFPVNDFINEFLSFYHLHIAQISPNGFRKIIAFILSCRALGIPLDITLFRHFYLTSVSGDVVTFPLRQARKAICIGIPDSVKKWKEDFFLVRSGAFYEGMDFTLLKGRDPDTAPELTTEQSSFVNKLTSFVAKWTDPDEVLLGMADLSPVYLERNVRPRYMVDSKEMLLFHKLRRDRVRGEVVIQEGPHIDFVCPSEAQMTLEVSESSDSTPDISTSTQGLAIVYSPNPKAQRWSLRVFKASQSSFSTSVSLSSDSDDECFTIRSGTESAGGKSLPTEGADRGRSKMKLKKRKVEGAGSFVPRPKASEVTSRIPKDANSPSKVLQDCPITTDPPDSDHR